MKALVLGAAGGIGNPLCHLLTAQGHNVIQYRRAELDLSNFAAERQLSMLLSKEQPDLIFNCAGMLGNNRSSHDEIFKVNVGSNWGIIQHYLNNQQDHRIRIVMLGSTAYHSGRAGYMLYAASKAALHNLWQGATLALPSNIVIGLLHPGPTRTKMIAHMMDPNKTYHEADDVATAMLALCNDMTVSTVQEMEYPK